MSSQPERWRAIPGHRGYEASSEGQVRSVLRKLRDGRTAGGVVLAQQRDHDGYRTVKLGTRRVRVNVAVQLAFAGPAEVRHLDGDPGEQQARESGLGFEDGQRAGQEDREPGRTGR